MVTNNIITLKLWNIFTAHQNDTQAAIALKCQKSIKIRDIYYKIYECWQILPLVSELRAVAKFSLYS